MIFSRTIPAAALILLASGCLTLKPRVPAHVEEGMASWYGPGFHGKTTSNKEIYDMYDMTAAHRTLPFGTHLIVTNLQNDRSVTIRINDRGPFVKDRIIDLSYAAAFQLDMLGPGVIPVRIEVIPDMSPDPTQQKFCVQVGSFSVERNAALLRDTLKKDHPAVYISRYSTRHRTYFRVRIKADGRERAIALASRLQGEGYRVLVLEEH